MADQPLFQNTDEQEAAYAPQETANPAAQEAVLAEEGTLGENRAAGGAGDDSAGAAVPLPGPGATGAFHNMGNISGSGTSSGATRIDDDDR